MFGLEPWQFTRWQAPAQHSGYTFCPCAQSPLSTPFLDCLQTPLEAVLCGKADPPHHPAASGASSASDLR